MVINNYEHKTEYSKSILINTLGLQEAKDSSSVENIKTTHNDIYKAELKTNSIESLKSKEVLDYIKALKKGFELINKQNLLTNRMIIEIQATLEKKCRFHSSLLLCLKFDKELGC